MRALLASLLVLVVSGALALLAGRRGRLAAWAGVGGSIVAAVLGLAAAAGGLAGDARVLRRPWMTALGGEFHLVLDPLAAFFLVPLFLVGGLAALYGSRYLEPEPDRSPGAVWGFFNLLLASMALAVTAGNALLFLCAWEAMALTSFCLVTYEHDRREASAAGRLYLIATHLGTAFLLVFMLGMARETGTLDIGAWRAAGVQLAPLMASVLFVCALVGFGTKAGFVPLHVWLPEAHPAAPSHVSALMSGVMIKTGIYGLLRFLPCLGPPPAWWGGALLFIGLTSGILGVLFALAQHDMKRLLAYHSVENIGIIALGLGLGSLGQSLGLPAVAAIGYAGALLHVVNHALFKSLLFLGAGAVYRATHTREIDELGGLLKWMPVTGACFLVGAAAISGLPPLNGFGSEFLVYWAALRGIVDGPIQGAVLMVLGATGLALIGGLAAACFAKLFGIVFLGEPRSAHAAPGREAALPMRVAMLVLACACVGLGFGLPAAAWVLAPVLSAVTGLEPAGVEAILAPGAGALRGVALMAGVLLAGVLVLALVRRGLLARREVRAAGTWDCGYARPTARMQYTASSFAQPLVGLFVAALRSRRRFRMAPGLFPASGSLETETRDVFRERLFTPFFIAAQQWIALLRWLQSGRVQLYVLYIVVTLLGLLFWALGGPP